MKVHYKAYRYEKAEPYPLLVKRRRAQRQKQMKVAATGFISLGCIVIFFVVGPWVRWEVTASKTRELVSPINATSKSRASQTRLLGMANSQNDRVLGTQSPNSRLTGKVEVKTMADGFSYFTPSEPVAVMPVKSMTYDEFTVTIPKLKIQNARTVVQSTEFEKNLGHLPGTALPGEIGNVFVTGHSALPNFFSPTNYKTIFTTLPNLQILDEVYVQAGSRKYKYVVEKTFVVEPSDISVIDPPDPFGKYLTLMTCVPPGMLTKRLIVLARLAE